MHGDRNVRWKRTIGRTRTSSWKLRYIPLDNIALYIYIIAERYIWTCNEVSVQKQGLWGDTLTNIPCKTLTLGVSLMKTNQSLMMTETLQNHLYYISRLYEYIHKKVTHWGRDKIPDIRQTVFWNAVSSMKMLSWNWALSLDVQSTINQHVFRWWLGIG